MRTSNFAELASRLDPDAVYTRTKASAALGVNSNGFARLVSANCLWLAFHDCKREGNRTLYSGVDLIDHFRRLDDWRAGCRLALDFDLPDGEFESKYGRAKSYVFGPETYLAQMGGWRTAVEV